MPEPQRNIDDETLRQTMADTLREDEGLLRRLAAGPKPAPTFDEAAEYVLTRNAELYRRLAAGPEPRSGDGA